MEIFVEVKQGIEISHLNNLNKIAIMLSSERLVQFVVLFVLKVLVTEESRQTQCLHETFHVHVYVW
jgi:hypothetical protein